jgi:hypothetical protein
VPVLGRKFTTTGVVPKETYLFYVYLYDESPEAAVARATAVNQVIRGGTVFNSTLSVANAYYGTQLLAAYSGSYGFGFSVLGAGTNFMSAHDNYYEGNTWLAAAQTGQGLGGIIVSGGRVLGVAGSRALGPYWAILSIANVDVQALTNLYIANGEVNSAFEATDGLVKTSISLMSDVSKIREQMKAQDCK